MKKEGENFKEKDKKLKTNTLSINRQKQLKPTFIWWGWKTV